MKAHVADKRRGEKKAGTPAETARSNMHKTAQDVMSVVVCSALVVLYCLAISELRGTVAERVAGRSAWGQLGFYLHCGFTIYEASLYTLLGNDEVQFLPPSCHLPRRTPPLVAAASSNSGVPLLPRFPCVPHTAAPCACPRTFAVRVVARAR